MEILIMELNFSNYIKLYDVICKFTCVYSGRWGDLQAR